MKVSFTTAIDEWVHALVLTNSLTDLSLIVNRKMKYWIAMSTIIYLKNIIWVYIYICSGTPLARPPTGRHSIRRVSGAASSGGRVAPALLKVSCIIAITSFLQLFPWLKVIQLCLKCCHSLSLLYYENGLADSVWAVPATGLFGLGRSGLETFRSGYEILEKSYMFTF